MIWDKDDSDDKLNWRRGLWVELFQYIYKKSENQIYVLNKELWISLDQKTLFILNKYFGEDNMHISHWSHSYFCEMW